MFIGEYSHTIDQKKRLSIPAKFRKALGKKAVITRGLDNCLFVYPFEAWKKVAGKLSQMPLVRSDARSFARLMLGGAMEVDFDGLGRILIPDYLKDYAGLGKRVVVVGLFDRLEIWDAEHWNKYKKETHKDADEIAERLQELGI